MAEKINGKNETFDPKILHDLLYYIPETGKLYWKARPVKYFSDSPCRTALHKANNWNSIYSETEAFTFTTHKKYKQGAIFHVNFLAHRIIWALVHGRWPENVIDHIDGDGSNNKIDNLREATLSNNSHNSKRPSHNISGLKGVGWCSRYGRWRSRIKINRKEIHLGYFNCKTAAHFAYIKASKKYHGEYGRVE